MTDAHDDAPPPHFSFLGFDVGYWESAYNHFSVVMNEVIFGKSDCLTSFFKKLNCNLLFDSMELAHQLISNRLKVSNRESRMIETVEEEVIPVAIFGLRRS